MSITYITDCKIYKESTHISKTNDPFFFLNGQNPRRQTCQKKNNYMSNKHMKISLASLIIREMQIKKPMKLAKEGLIIPNDGEMSNN